MRVLQQSTAKQVAADVEGLERSELCQRSYHARMRGTVVKTGAHAQSSARRQ
jgi:hypothetical protein